MYSQRTLQQKSLKLGSLGLLLILTLTLMGQVDKTRVASIDEVVKTAKQVNLPAGGGVTQIAIQKDVLKVERDGIVHMTVPADQVMDVTVTGTPEEDDTFRIPVTSTLRGTVKVDGGRGGYDVLKIPEGDAERIIFNFYNANDGNVKFDFDGDHCTDFKIEYIGLEPVTNSGTAADMVFNYSTDAETITISSASSTQTELASTHAETTTFTNPTNSLTINAGDTGNDIIKVSSMSSGFNASLTVNGQGGSDTFTVNANLSIGSNNFTINTESIGSDNSDIEFLCGNFNLSGNLSVSGDVTVDASSLTTSGSMASTGGGNLFLNCNSIAFGGNVQSTGMLSIVPLSGSTTIGIGGGSGTLNLDDTDLGYLADGFADIIIGDGSSGDLNISSATFNDPVSLSSGGSIKNDDSNPNITAPSVGVFGNSTPGQSPGILNISGNFIFAEGASFSVEFGGTSPGSASNNHDQLSVSGSVTISSNIPLNTSSYGGYTPSNGATYTIISNGSGAVSGTFKNLAEGAIVSNDFLGSGIPASISYIGGDGNDVVLTVDASLAVTLHSLSAVYENGSMSLHWVTDSETENVGFVLELENSRSPLRWEVIASHETHDELRGQGNSSERHEYVFIDNNVEAGQSYVYRLSDVNTSGEVHVYDDISIDLPDAPEVTVLDPPFPNPFNPQTKISYQLAETGSVEIIIYDLLGRKVQSLVSEKQIAGSYNMYWHGDDEFGQKVATGTYLIVLKTVEGVRTQKVVMLR